MTAVLLPSRNVILAYCSPPTGNFGLEADVADRVATWDHCREQFAAKFNDKTKGFFFSHKDCKTQELADFIIRFEQIAQSSRKNFRFKYSQFSPTSSVNITYIQPSKFWLDCYFKRSLFTILCRCAINYEATTRKFEDVLFDSRVKDSAYLVETKPAVLRFMFGFTKYVGISPVLGESTVIKHGWVEEFQKLDIQAIRKRLVLPDNMKKYSNIVGTDSLWN